MFITFDSVTLKKYNMRTPQSINWELESKLINIQEVSEDYYEEKAHIIYFEYNGYRITATVDFTLDLIQRVEEETNFKETELEDVFLEIQEMYDEEDNLFKVPMKELIAMEYQLQTELKTQY